MNFWSKKTMCVIGEENRARFQHIREYFVSLHSNFLFFCRNSCFSKNVSFFRKNKICSIRRIFFFRVKIRFFKKFQFFRWNHWMMQPPIFSMKLRRPSSHTHLHRRNYTEWSHKLSTDWSPHASNVRLRLDNKSMQRQDHRLTYTAVVGRNHVE